MSKKEEKPKKKRSQKQVAAIAMNRKFGREALAMDIEALEEDDPRDYCDDFDLDPDRNEWWY